MRAICHSGREECFNANRQVLLVERLRAAIVRLNPAMPLAAREDALRQVDDLGVPALLAANRRSHHFLVNGVPVQYQRDGETRGDFARLVDWVSPSGSAGVPAGNADRMSALQTGSLNDWLAVNQFSIKGPRHKRRADIILFLNGLPQVLLELKNPADEKADIWKAFKWLKPRQTGKKMSSAAAAGELQSKSCSDLSVRSNCRPALTAVVIIFVLVYLGMLLVIGVK